MKQVDQMPIEGQFVAVFQNQNGVWAGTFLIEDGILHEYNGAEDSWDSYPDPYFVMGNNHSTSYFVSE